MIYLNIGKCRYGEIWLANFHFLSDSSYVKKDNNNQYTITPKKKFVLIISANETSLCRNNVLVALITSNLSTKARPNVVFLPSNEKILPEDSLIQCSQIFSINKEDLIDKVADLPEKYKEKVFVALMIELNFKYYFNGASSDINEEPI